MFVLRNERLNPPEVAAIQQAIKFYALDDPRRKQQCKIIITHCDSLSSEENEKVQKRYVDHPVVGKLHCILSVNTEAAAVVQFSNFFCVGLPDLTSMDPELAPIYRKRLVVQRQALIGLLAGFRSPAIPPTKSWLKDMCAIS